MPQKCLGGVWDHPRPILDNFRPILDQNRLKNYIMKIPIKNPCEIWQERPVTLDKTKQSDLLPPLWVLKRPGAAVQGEALLGPFIWALLGPFICWALLGPFICWALLGPFICWALLGPF